MQQYGHQVAEPRLRLVLAVGVRPKIISFPRTQRVGKTGSVLSGVCSF